MSTAHKEGANEARAFLLSSDTAVCAKLTTACEALPGFHFVRVVNEMPEVSDFIRMLQVYTPQIIFLAAEPLAQMAELLAAVRRESSEIQVIAIHSRYDANLLLEVMRLGVQEFIAPPFDDERAVQVISRVIDRCAAGPVDFDGMGRVYSFLPAKQGVGATTLAVNSAIHFEKLQNERAFLGDFDIQSGLIRFMLKLNCQASLQDAALKIMELDSRMWTNLISTRGSLDILHAGPHDPEVCVDPHQAHRLITFLRRNYRLICADLSGNLEKFSLEIMRESRRIYLVTTPELPILHLAAEKIALLKELDLGDRVSVLVNRVSRNCAVTEEMMTNILRRPVHMTFPNAYRTVHQSLTAGTPIGTGTDLGRACAKLAKEIAGPARLQVKLKPINWWVSLTSRLGIAAS